MCKSIDVKVGQKYRGPCVRFLAFPTLLSLRNQKYKLCMLDSWPSFPIKVGVEFHITIQAKYIKKDDQNIATSFLQGKYYSPENN